MKDEEFSWSLARDFQENNMHGIIMPCVPRVELLDVCFRSHGLEIRLASADVLEGGKDGVLLVAIGCLPKPLWHAQRVSDEPFWKVHVCQCARGAQESGGAGGCRRVGAQGGIANWDGSGRGGGKDAPSERVNRGGGRRGSVRMSAQEDAGALRGARACVRECV